MISRTEFFWNHILVLVIVFVYTFGMSYLLYWLTNKIVPMRVSPSSEAKGLDSSEHGEDYVHDATNSPSDMEWYRGIEEN